MAVGQNRNMQDVEYAGTGEHRGQGGQRRSISSFFLLVRGAILIVLLLLRGTQSGYSSSMGLTQGNT